MNMSMGGGVFFCSALAFIICVLLIPLIITLCKKNNWYDEIDSRKVHQGLVPRLGGIGIFLSFFIAVAIYLHFFSESDFRYALPVFLGGLIIFLFGVIDDFLNLHARFKFLIQIVSALIVSCSPLYSNMFFGFQVPAILGRCITFSWILFLVNAYNLIDGLDLLCGGLSFITLLTSGIFLIHGGQSVGALCIILCSSILGFLIFNKPTAKIFLGDGGSQTLGFVIAIIPLFHVQGSVEYTKILIALLMTSIPVTDVIAAVIRRAKAHRSFFSADRAHIHHKLVNIGFSKVEAVVTLLSIQLFISFAALATIFMTRIRDAIILLTVCIVLVWSFFIILHYINLTVNRKHNGHLSPSPQEEH